MELASGLLASIEHIRSILELAARVGDIKTLPWATQDETLWDYMDSVIADARKVLHASGVRTRTQEPAGVLQLRLD
jgi:hypothetical protein